MPRRFSRLLFRLGLERLPIMLAGLIFLVEICDMFLIRLLPRMPRLWLAVIDSSILIIALSPAYFFIIRPILMERKRAEEEIRQLSRQLIRAEEKIRKKLARDLHDEFGQVLTALQFGVETVCSGLLPEQKKLEAHCSRLSGMIAQLGNHVRDITAELRPSILDSIGLVPALRWHVKQFESIHPGIAVAIRVKGHTERLPSELEVALYRVCQESLNNVAKHASARHVSIDLHMSFELLTLTVKDDGVGFDFERSHDPVAPPRGFGIPGMRERIADLGGQFEISSRPTHGTEVRVALPLNRGEESA